MQAVFHRIRVYNGGGFYPLLFKKFQSFNMQEYYNVKRLALVLAVQAEMEGMKAENMLREQVNEAPAYGAQHFNELAERLENLAYAHNEQL